MFGAPLASRLKTLVCNYCVGPQKATPWKHQLQLRSSKSGNLWLERLVTEVCVHHISDGETEAQSHVWVCVQGPSWDQQQLRGTSCLPCAQSPISGCRLLTTWLWLPPVHMDTVLSTWWCVDLKPMVPLTPGFMPPSHNRTLCNSL